MTINLVTGAAGFVASHLIQYLLEKGETVYGTFRWNEDLSRMKSFENHSNFHGISMDLNDLSSCIKAVEESKPDYVFHLAAQSFVPDSFIYPVETIRTNTCGTFNILEAIRMVRDNLEPNVDFTEPNNCDFNPVIHVCSSSEVYGMVKEKDLPITEKNELSPNNPYAIGKIGADMTALWFYKQYGLKVIRTRMFTHTGPGRTMMSAECNFAKQIAEFEKALTLASNGNPIDLNNTQFILKHGNLDSLRTWADVRDAVRAYYLLVRKCKSGEVYNIGGDTVKSIKEMLDYLLSTSPIKDKIKLHEDPSLLRKADVTTQIVDTSKFKKATDWKPEISFEKTMDDLMDWWRKNG